MRHPIVLDERLGAIAAITMEAIKGMKHACAADIGCDHGYLSAYLLENCPQLRMIASDVSAPSLEKAKELMAARGLGARVKLAVADGLGAVDEPVNVIIMAGMGAQTILGIISEGRERIGNAALLLQSNVDLPMLRTELARLGFCVEREAFTCAAGRHYVTLLVRRGSARELSEKEALLGEAISGVKDAGQRAYFLWQRGVRVREMEQVARLNSIKAGERTEKNSRELGWIAEAIGMKTCTVGAIEAMVGDLAPFELAEEWDNVGLLVGRRGAEAARVLVALDVTQGVIEEAKALGAQVILTHHPLMFSARKRMTDDDREGALLLSMAQAGIAHIAAHTNLDAAPGGVNDTLMALLGAQNVTGEGFVRVGDMPQGMTLEALAQRARRSLKADVRVYGAMDTPVCRLGCCSGSGSSEIEQAVRMGADCFITGEVRHNLALDAMDMGCTIIEAGHYETENPVCEVLRTALQNAADTLQYKVTFFCSKVNPFGR